MVSTSISNATEESCSPISQEEGMDDSFQAQIKRTLYGGVKVPNCFNLPFTDVAVEYFQESVPRSLRDLQRGFPAPLARHACVSPCSVILSMIYAKRLRQKNPEYLLQISSSDLFFISMMVASKYLYNEGDEDEVMVDEWAEDADCDMDDVVELERNFLAAVEWDLFVKNEEFEAALKDMERKLALRAGLSRGWLTYSELQVLAGSPAEIVWSQVGSHWVQVMVVSSVAYLAGIMTMVGSTALVLNHPAVAFAVATTMSAGLTHLAPSHAFLFSRSAYDLQPLLTVGDLDPRSHDADPPVPGAAFNLQVVGNDDLRMKTFNSAAVFVVDDAAKTASVEEEGRMSPGMKSRPQPPDGTSSQAFGKQRHHESEIGYTAQSRAPSGFEGSSRDPSKMSDGDRLRNDSRSTRTASGRSRNSRGGTSVALKAIVERLWSLLTLKNTLLQFVSAAADEYSAQGQPGNRNCKRTKKNLQSACIPASSTPSSANCIPVSSTPSSANCIPVSLTPSSANCIPVSSTPAPSDSFSGPELPLARSSLGTFDGAVDSGIDSVHKEGPRPEASTRPQCRCPSLYWDGVRRLRQAESEAGPTFQETWPSGNGCPAEWCHRLRDVPVPLSDPEVFSDWPLGFATSSYLKFPVAA